ncbi:MAG: ribosome small subunit-dependent GTPase A [Spirochaetales bacterium]|nr:ribosome small subunit-dependent GTPase A [Spirochaetales bacterium]
MVKGTVLYGINNIFTVATEQGTRECRLKGKTLKDAEGEHNPLAPGDRVLFEEDPQEPRAGLIARRLPRQNAFTRWNRNSQSFQTLAVNLDRVVCVSSAEKPPFRPRFIDRVCMEAEKGGIPLIILLNKIDLGLPDEVRKRMIDYRRLGYDVFTCSARKHQGLEEIKTMVDQGTSVFLGQSGVGKSTILNTLFPGLGLRTGEISRKYNRGIHTTVFSLMIPQENGAIIDTPGIRELDVRGVSPVELPWLFRDFRSFIPSCSLRNCSHLEEPGCAVREAVASGGIHPDRYESYKTLLASLVEQEESKYR